METGLREEVTRGDLDMGEVSTPDAFRWTANGHHN